MSECRFSSPARILLIGNGRVAHHFKNYLNLLKLEVTTWKRSEGLDHLATLVLNHTHIFLAISDSSLQSFYNQNLSTFPGFVLHFSGALSIPGTLDLHPLMSFGPGLYELSTYEKIAFVSSHPDLPIVVGGIFANAIHQIPEKDKSFYHALCVVGGNLSTLLIQNMLKGFTELKLPPDIAKIYLQQVIENIFTYPKGALTGPIARKDFITIEKNIESLNSHQKTGLAEIYRSFAQQGDSQ